jgi:regulator of sigma E protease
VSWLLAFLGFALLIILHELGHFAAAKAVGMRVEKFSLFFGPMWTKVTRGETVYGIGTVPLGGYVKITGMSPDEAKELPPELYVRSYAGSAVWKRIVVISAGPLVNVVIAFVMLLGIYWHEGKAEPGIAVGTVESTFKSAQVLHENDRIVKIVAPANGSTPEKVALGDAPGLTEKQLGDRTTAMRNLIVDGGCGAVSLGTKGADGAPQVARCATPQPLQVTVDRAGTQRTFAITPQYDAQRKRYRLGIGFSSPLVAIGPVTAAGESVDQMWFVTKASVESIVKIVYDPQARKQVSSVVGGYETTRQSFEVSTVQALLVLALISLSLAIINLFPFLPLDGGHIFWALVEKARGGRQVSTVVLERSSIVGLVLVLALFAVGLSNDIGHIVDHTGFGVK